MGRSKVAVKPKGKKSPYAFFVQACREELRKSHPDQAVNFPEFSKRCAEKWKVMTAVEKALFLTKAEADKKRYEEEMASYAPGESGKGKAVRERKKRVKETDAPLQPEAVKSVREPKRHVKHPDAPKRNLSAFFWFCNKERAKVIEMYPEYRVGAIAKELGCRWSKVDTKTKEWFNLMAQKDRERYQREMIDFKRTKTTRPETEEDEIERESEEKNSGANEVVHMDHDSSGSDTTVFDEPMAEADEKVDEVGTMAEKDDKEPEDGDKEPEDGDKEPEDGDKEPVDDDKEPEDAEKEAEDDELGTKDEEMEVESTE